MTFSEIELHKIKKLVGSFCEKRTPAHIRDQLRVEYKIQKQEIIISEIRPQWNNLDKIIETPIAKTTYVKKQKLWKVYWQRADMKWHSYEPQPTVKMLEDFLVLVGEDQHA